MKSKVTVILIPEDGRRMKRFSVPRVVLPGGTLILWMFLCGSGYILMDYLNLLHIRAKYQDVVTENLGLKGESRILLSHLEEVRKSLQKVHDFSTKLSEMTALSVRTVSEKTGIGPLSELESMANEKESKEPSYLRHVPLGVDVSKLVFKPTLDQLSLVGQKAATQAVDLQKLLSILSERRSLLNSVPSMSPVEGWITSNFGRRVSPFTGEINDHLGIDIAAPPGTPILAPADGIVVFSGTRSGFGNSILIAHGYGIVTLYGHNAQNMVQAGQRVERGTQIGTVGSTGRSTGPHLHFEVHIHGNPTDPQKFLLDALDLTIF